MIKLLFVILVLVLQSVALGADTPSYVLLIPSTPFDEAASLIYVSEDGKDAQQLLRFPDMSSPNWLQVDPARKWFAYSDWNEEKQEGSLRVVEVGNNIKVHDKTLPNVTFSGVWGDEADAGSIVAPISFPKQRSPDAKFLKFTLPDLKSSEIKNAEVTLAPAMGAALQSPRSGGPIAIWDPASPENIQLTIAKNPVNISFPGKNIPKELYANRSSRWMAIGDIKSSFGLVEVYDGPTQKSTRLIYYLASQAKWNHGDFAGAQSNAYEIESNLIFEEAKPNPKNEKYVNYGVDRTGKFQIVSLKTGAILSLETKPDSQVLYANPTMLLIREDDQISEFPIVGDHLGTPRVVSKRPAMSFVRYAFPVQQLPNVVAPDALKVQLEPPATGKKP